RFYDATEGHVFVDGKDVKCYDPVTLRDIVVTVPQKAVLVSGTVRSNLLWGNENATDEQLWAALDAAQAKEFVEQKPEGLDAPVTQNGSNFSGGQRQRLTIARALVAQSPVLILDDSASALDFATDAALRRALKSLPHSPTTFIVSQRTASIAHADLILVLEDGALVGQGTHDALLSSCAVYREIYDSQFKGGQGA
ncbi:MAG: ABC transporter ATP-binding protein, partial [Clostridia bacterium]|nr:ABC transporter ATP-binding protein [Clostridia bacterium]